MRFTSVIAAAIPLLSCFATLSFARPIRSGSGGLDVRSLPPDESYTLAMRSLSNHLDTALEARARGAPYTVPKAPKISKTTQQKRKADLQAAVAINQAAKAKKKAEIKAMGPAPKYRPPRGAKPGYRAKERAAGKRLEKQPKTPKPNMAKGAEKSQKARSKQAKANRLSKDRRRAGKIMFADAKAKYGKTTGLPHRMTEYTVLGPKDPVTKEDVPITVFGKNVRAAAFNTHHFQGNNPKKLTSPKVFQNRPQGPANNQVKPLPQMVGPGQEFPITAKKGGYQDGPSGNKGPMRVITQHNDDGGTSVMGVVSHDPKKASGDPGFNDHHHVPGVRRNSKPRYRVKFPPA